MWKKVLFACSLLLGLAGFAAVPFIVGINNVLGAFQRTGVACIASFLAVAGMTIVIPAVGWWIIMRGEEIPVSLWQAIKANLMGFPINMLAPSAYLGSEPLKMVYISRVAGVTKRRVLATIIVAKVQELAGLILVTIVSAAIYLGRVKMNRAQGIGVAATTGVMVLAIVLAMIGFIRNAQPTVKVINVLARFRFKRRRMARLRSRAREMENMIHAAFTHRWKRFLVAQAVTFGSAVSLFFRPWIYFVYDPHVGSLGAEHLSAIYFITNVINTISFTPGGLGIFEGGMVAYFKASGLGDAAGAAFSIANRIFDIFYIMIGGWLIAHTGLTGVAKGITSGSQKVLTPEDMPTAADL